MIAGLRVTRGTFGPVAGSPGDGAGRTWAAMIAGSASLIVGMFPGMAVVKTKR